MTNPAERWWREKYFAATRIKERFGLDNAISYLVGEKLMQFASYAEEEPEYRQELPKFVAAVKELFSREQLETYIVGQKPRVRTAMRELFLRFEPFILVLPQKPRVRNSRR